MSLSFSSPHKDVSSTFSASDNAESSSLQASTLHSFNTNNTCLMEYSTDEVDSLTLLPISPVSQDDEEQHETGSSSSDPCKISPRKGEEHFFSTMNVSLSGLHCKSSVSDKNDNDGRAEKVDTYSSASQDFNRHASIPHGGLSQPEEVKHGDLTATQEVETKSLIPPEKSSRPRKNNCCNNRNDDGQSALSISSSNCFLRGMMLLIEKGADVNLVDIYGRAPVHLACENAQFIEHHDCIAYLLDNGADANVQDAFGRSALHIAAKTGCSQCISLLLEHGAKTALKDSVGDTALHVAASMGHLECMDILSTVYDEIESHSSVESVSLSEYGEHITQMKSDAVTSFYESPRGYYSTSRTRLHSAMTGVISPNNFRTNDAEHSLSIQSSSHQNPSKTNDSGYFSTKSNAWTKSKYYVDKLIDDEEESVESLIDYVRDEIDILNDLDLRGHFWLSASVEILFQWLLSTVQFLFYNWYQPFSRSSMHSENLTEKASMFAQPPDHVREAMERFKLSQREDALTPTN